MHLIVTIAWTETININAPVPEPKQERKLKIIFLNRWSDLLTQKLKTEINGKLNENFTFIYLHHVLIMITGFLSYLLFILGSQVDSNKKLLSQISERKDWIYFHHQMGTI